MVGNRVRGGPCPGRGPDLARLGTSLGFVCILVFLYGLLTFVFISALSFIPYFWLSLVFPFPPLSLLADCSLVDLRLSLFAVFLYLSSLFILVVSALLLSLYSSSRLFFFPTISVLRVL